VSELSGILEDERDSGHGRAAILQEEEVLRISAEKEIESLKVSLATSYAYGEQPSLA
jgi:hypothetical protein